jgi:hypothetical protein
MTVKKDFLDDVATAIESSGLAEKGKTLFIGLMPNSPSSCVTVLPAGGVVWEHPLRQVIKEHSIQVQVRDPDFVLAEAKADSIFDLLADNADVLTTSVRGIIQPTSIPIMYRDERNYVVLSLNFRAQTIPK